MNELNKNEFSYGNFYNGKIYKRKFSVKDVNPQGKSAKKIDIQPKQNAQHIQRTQHTAHNHVQQQAPQHHVSPQIQHKTRAQNKTQTSQIHSSKNQKVRFSIGAKLISIISIILTTSLVGVTMLVSYFVSKDTKINAEENNLTINSRTANDCENRINSILSATQAFSELLTSSSDITEISSNSTIFFEHYPEIAGVYYTTTKKSFINRSFFAQHELEDEIIENYAETENQNIENANMGSIILKNLSVLFQSPMLAIFNPLFEQENSSVIIFYNTESLQESFSSGTINQSIFLNNEGEILIHPNIQLMMETKDLSENEVFKNMKRSSIDNSQNYFTNEDGSQYIAAYKRIKNTGCAVITTVELNVILEGIQATTRRNIYLTIAILSISIMIIWFFSRSLSIPIRKLADVTNEINKGNFNTKLFDELETKHHDEIAVLTNSTKNERSILNTITKLTNIGVVRSVIQKQVDFEPHLKDITIFFSDIRGFTAISDGFNTRFGKASSAEIIGFLNDYMRRMVQCITITGGTVDKFEGDAIMACWGVLRNDDLSFEEMENSNPQKAKLKQIHEKNKQKDALSAIQATIAMRYALRKYNKDAILFTKANQGKPNAKYKPQIKIGCGLNSGRATVGFMGSWEKMEFTSIGDAVNLASRTESSNKPCGTDILITQDTLKLLKNYIRCKENNYTIKEENKQFEIIIEKIPVAFEVKGKGKQHFYGIVNMPHFDVESFFKKADANFKADKDCLDAVGPRGPRTLKEMRKILGIAEPNFEGVNLDEEENKIQPSLT